MNDISRISGPKLTSQVKVSLESTQKSQIDTASELKEVKQFEVEMEQIENALASVDQIRRALEQALKDLTPNA